MIFMHVYKCSGKTKIFSKKMLIKNLARYLNQSTKEINMHYNKNGKPMVDGLYFSVSHCRNHIVQIFSKDSEIGIDIEYINPKRPYLKLAKRYFHALEIKYLNKLPHKLSLDLFYNIWTAKEAVCKTQGGRLWYYLADNYITKNLAITPEMKGINLQHLNTIPNYSVCIASTKKIEKIVNV